MRSHIGNFLGCMRTREKPHLDVETGAKRRGGDQPGRRVVPEGKTMYWDAKNWKSSDKPVKA